MPKFDTAIIIFKIYSEKFTEKTWAIFRDKVLNPIVCLPAERDSYMFVLKGILFQVPEFTENKNTQRYLKRPQSINFAHSNK